jgi:hypothetical protein
VREMIMREKRMLCNVDIVVVEREDGAVGVVG